MTISSTMNSFANITAITDVLNVIIGKLNVREICRLAQVSINLQQAVESAWKTSNLDNSENREFLATLYAKKYTVIMDLASIVPEQMHDTFLLELEREALRAVEGLCSEDKQMLETAYFKTADEITPKVIEAMENFQAQKVRDTCTLNEIKTMYILSQCPEYVLAIKKMIRMAGELYSPQLPMILEKLGFAKLMQMHYAEQRQQD